MTDTQMERWTKIIWKKTNTNFAMLVPQIQSICIIHKWRVSPQRVHCHQLLYKSKNITVIIKIIKFSTYIKFNQHNFNLPLSILLFCFNKNFLELLLGCSMVSLGLLTREQPTDYQKIQNIKNEKDIFVFLKLKPWITIALMSRGN